MGFHAWLLVDALGPARARLRATGRGVRVHGTATAALRGGAATTRTGILLDRRKLALGWPPTCVVPGTLGSAKSRLGLGSRALGTRTAPLALPSRPLARPVAPHGRESAPISGQGKVIRPGALLAPLWV